MGLLLSSVAFVVDGVVGHVGVNMQKWHAHVRARNAKSQMLSGTKQPCTHTSLAQHYDGRGDMRACGVGPVCEEDPIATLAAGWRIYIC